MSFFRSVYITVGGESYYTVFELEYRGCAGLRDSSNQQLEPPYDIDWCQFTLVMLAVLFPWLNYRPAKAKQKAKL